MTRQSEQLGKALGSECIALHRILRGLIKLEEYGPITLKRVEVELRKETLLPREHGIGGQATPHIRVDTATSILVEHGVYYTMPQIEAAYADLYSQVNWDRNPRIPDDGIFDLEDNPDDYDEWS